MLHQRPVVPASPTARHHRGMARERRASEPVVATAGRRRRSPSMVICDAPTPGPAGCASDRSGGARLPRRLEYARQPRAAALRLPVRRGARGHRRPWSPRSRLCPAADDRHHVGRTRSPTDLGEESYTVMRRQYLRRRRCSTLGICVHAVLLGNPLFAGLVRRGGPGRLQPTPSTGRGPATSSPPIVSGFAADQCVGPWARAAASPGARCDPRRFPARRRLARARAVTPSHRPRPRRRSRSSSPPATSTVPTTRSTPTG